MERGLTITCTRSTMPNEWKAVATRNGERVRGGIGFGASQLDAVRDCTKGLALVSPELELCYRYTLTDEGRKALADATGER